MNKNEILAFTDGASRGNPGPGGFGAVVLIGGTQVKEWGGREDSTTNNRMELMAVIVMVRGLIGRKEKLIIHTDSRYVLNGITKWVNGWKRNNWMTASKLEVKNRDLWEELDQVTHEYKKKAYLEWVHVPGHSGLLGNEQADKIATYFADKKEYHLFDGKVDDFGTDISNVVIDIEKVKKRSAAKTRSKGKAYSYVSCVNGEVYIDKDWATCESRVKGKRGVKFRKALSKDEEDSLVKEWKV